MRIVALIACRYKKTRNGEKFEKFHLLSQNSYHSPRLQVKSHISVFFYTFPLSEIHCYLDDDSGGGAKRGAVSSESEPQDGEPVCHEEAQASWHHRHSIEQHTPPHTVSVPRLTLGGILHNRE